MRPATLTLIGHNPESTHLLLASIAEVDSVVVYIIGEQLSYARQTTVIDASLDTGFATSAIESEEHGKITPHHLYSPLFLPFTGKSSKFWM